MDLFALTIRVTVLLLIAMLIGSQLRKRPALCHTVLLGGLLAAFAVPLLELSRSGLQLPTHVVHLTTAAVLEPEHFDTSLPQPVAEDVPMTVTMRHPPEAIADPTVSELPPVSAVIAKSPQQEHGRTPIQFQLPQWSWGGMVPAAWLLGTLFRMAGLCHATWCLRRLVNECGSASAEFGEQTTACLGHNRFGVRLSQSLSVPIAVGIFRPVVLLPQELTTELSASQLQAVLLHEAAHLRRMDPLTVLLQEFLASLLWWNPIVHLFNRRLTQAREDICDTYALSASSRESYSEALLLIAGRPPKYTSRIVTAGSSGQLAKRVAFILTEGRNMMTTVSKHVAWTVFSVYLVFACALTLTSVTMRPAEAEQPQNEITAPKKMITITGQVLDPNGKPVPEAPVSVMVERHKDHLYWHPDDRTELAHNKTGPNGRFRITFAQPPPPKSYKLTVYTVVPKYALAWKHLDIHENSHKPILRLTPDDPLNVKIVDSKWNPVANAEATLDVCMFGPTDEPPNNWNGLYFPFELDALKPSTVNSNQQGKFLLRGTIREMKHAIVEVKHRGFAPQRVAFNPSETTTISINLGTTPHPVTGKLVYGETGKPAVGSDITVFSYNGNSTVGFRFSGFVTGNVDSQGHFRVIPFRGDVFKIGVFSSEGKFVSLVDRQPAEDVFDRPHDLVLPEGITLKEDGHSASTRPRRNVTITGTVTGPSGAPIKVGTVIPPSGSTVQIRKGHVYIPGLVPGTKQKVFFVDAENQLGAAITLVPQEKLHINVRLSTCASATVRLVDDQGKPYSNVDVHSSKDLDFRLALMRHDHRRPSFGHVNYRLDSISVSRFDGRYRGLRTGADGRLTFPTIIPGANYRVFGGDYLLIRKNGLPVVAGAAVAPEDVTILRAPGLTKRHFRAKPGEKLDLGTITFRRRSDPSQPSFGHPEGVAQPLGTPEELAEVTAKVAQLAREVLPAVVAVGGGSGVVVSEDGYVLTAAHVLEKPGEDVTVTFSDGTSARGKVLGMCPTLDIALVKITEQGRKWPFAEKGISGDLPSADWCFAVGCQRTSGSGRTPVIRIGQILDASEDDVWTTCTLVGGDSGGPLFDMNGKIVGVNSHMGRVAESHYHPSIDAFERNWDRLVKGDLWTVYDPE